VLSHPLVTQASAIAVKTPGMEHAAGDEEVIILLVLEPGAELEPEALVAYLAGRMPRHWIPRFIEYVAGLPRTPTHK
jgi:carnitine-CoA ligase